jgi:hypothetical protein
MQVWHLACCIGRDKRFVEARTATGMGGAGSSGYIQLRYIERAFPQKRDLQMLEITIELLSALCSVILALFITFCIVGSILAALRAVSIESATVGKRN